VFAKAGDSRLNRRESGRRHVENGKILDATLVRFQAFFCHMQMFVVVKTKVFIVQHFP
jgi:hypothetical protein